MPRGAGVQPAHVTARCRSDGRHDAVEGEHGPHGGVADGEPALQEDGEVLSEEERGEGEEEAEGDEVTYPSVRVGAAGGGRSAGEGYATPLLVRLSGGAGWFGRPHGGDTGQHQQEVEDVDEGTCEHVELERGVCVCHLSPYEGADDEAQTTDGVEGAQDGGAVFTGGDVGKVGLGG